MAVDLATRDSLDAALAGLDALDTPPPRDRRRGLALAVVPKVVAVLLGGLAWQAVVWSGWRPDYLLPGPMAVLHTLVLQVGMSDFWAAVGTTMTRAVESYIAALLVGVLVGLAVIRSKILRSGVGALLTGLLSMPSIVWLPLAGILFAGADPGPAITFVVLLGAAPAIAGGMVAGVDHVDPVLVRAGRSMGAGGLRLIRLVILPAAFPEIMGGLKQGWALAWRSLMSAELIHVSAETIGGRLNFAQDNLDSNLLVAMMVVILVIGIVADSLFGIADRRIRRRWGLLRQD